MDSGFKDMPYDDMTGVDPDETVEDIASSMRKYADKLETVSEYHSDAVALLLRHYAKRIDNALDRQFKVKDTYWEETCAKCRDGEIEPKFCEFYGEPNGCNSPDPGHHPAILGANMAKVRNALADLVLAFSNVMGCDVLRFGDDHCDGIRSDGKCPNKVNCDRIFNAMRVLKSTPRNCDRPFRSVYEIIGRYISESNPGGEPRMTVPDAIAWMLAPQGDVKEKNGKWVSE